MALRLRTNGAPLSGALFVSNPRKRKATTRKRKRKTSTKRRSRTVRSRANSKRKVSAATKAKRAATLRALRNRRNAKKTHKNSTTSRSRSLAAKKAAVTRKRNAAKRSAAAKKAAATRKRNASKKRAYGTKRGAVRKTARRAITKTAGGLQKTVRRAFMRKPVRNRRNSSVSLKTAYNNKLTAPVSRLVGKLPVIGSMAKQFVGPLMLGAGAAAVHYYGVKAMQRFAPGVAARVAPVQFSLAGALVAALLYKGGSLPLLKKLSAKSRGQLASASLLLGGGFDAYRALSARMGDLGSEMPLYDFSGLGVDLGSEMPLYDYSGIGVDLGAEMPLYDYSGIGVDLGDGSAYDVVPAYGGLGYEAAEFGDAHGAPDDLSVDEGEAALSGPAGYFHRFGPCPVTRSRRGGGYMSSLAGRPGHRWGWLVKLVGFDRFQKIAGLPPQQRIALIQQMKAQAVSLADESQVEQEEGSLSGLALDFGAVMHAGSTF